MENTATTFLAGKNALADSRAKRTIAVMIILMAAAAAPIFAAGGSIAQLDSMGEKIIGLIGAPWVKALLAVGLIVEFGVIAFGNAQGEGGMVKKVLPWIIGTAGILGAVSIVKFMFNGISVGNFSS